MTELLLEKIGNYFVRFICAVRGKKILGLKEAHAIRQRAAGKFTSGEKPSQFAIIAIAAEVLRVPVRIQEEGQLVVRTASCKCERIEERRSHFKKEKDAEIRRLYQEIADSERESKIKKSEFAEMKKSAKADMDFFK